MNGWSSQRLKHLCEIRVSNVDKKSVEGQLPVRLCNYTDVYYNDRIVPGSEFMEATASHEQARAFRLQNGDILITKDSETADDIGVAALVEGSHCDVLCGYHLALLRPHRSLIEPRFLAWAITSDAVRSQFSAAATGVTRFGLRRDAIGEALIRTPSVREQRAIADFLDAETARIDALIGNKRRMTALLRERLRVLVRSRLDSLGAAVVPLKRRWRVIDCKHRTPRYVADGFPVVSPGDTTPGRLDLTRCHRFVDEQDYGDLTSGDRRPQRGDVIYSRNASIGIASYVDSDQPFCMGQDVCRVTSTGESQLFLTYVLNIVGADQLDVEKMGSTFDRVNVARILELAVPWPPFSVQASVAAELDQVSALHDEADRALLRQMKLLAEHQEALITAAVDGTLEVGGVA